jgi:hypothetical protein
MEPAARLFSWGTGLFVRVWFWCTFLVGVAFIFVMPAFQTNDETHHWEKMYTVMQRDDTCGQIPAGVEEVIARSVYEQIRGGWKWEFRRYDDAFATRLGDPHDIMYKQACPYKMTAYAIPALMAKVAQWWWPTDWGRIMAAYYAGRIGNWLVLTVCVWLALWSLPRLRTWVLTVYSVPMVIHQSASINQDSTIIGLHLVLLVLLLRARPVWKLVGIALVAHMLTELKPVFAPIFLFLTVPVWELLGEWSVVRRRQIFLGLTVLAGLIIVSSPLWIASLLRHTLAQLWSVPWASSARQTELMIARPWIVLAAFRTQLLDNLGHGHLVGGFTSITAVFGWAQYEVNCYKEVITAAVLALLADLVSPSTPSLVQRRHDGWLHALWCRVVPGLSPFLVVGLVDLGFYLFFTVPGSKFIIGVQGRYYFGPLLLIGVGMIFWGGGDIERLVARLKRDASTVLAVRSLATLLLAGAAFYKIVSAWGTSYTLISEIYYHHYATW